MTSVLCPLEGCDHEVEVPEQGGPLVYIAAYHELEQHVLHHHTIHHLIDALWHRVVADARAGGVST